MSAAAGGGLLAPEERQPLQLSTFGVGGMLRHAAAQGCAQIVVGLGGSATNDGGFGLARALGFRFLDRAGHNLAEEVSALTNLDQIVPPNDLDLPSVVAAYDVSNPLLGPEGATRVFGPQKGAGPAEIEILERALLRLAEIAAQTIGRDHRAAPGAGAAGGLGFGLAAFAHAELRPGFDVVAEAVGLREKIERADFVVTGEGKLDGQTPAGKAPAGVARLARELGKPVYAIVGQATNQPDVRSLFDAVLTLDDLSLDFRETSSLLGTRARELALRLR